MYMSGIEVHYINVPITSLHLIIKSSPLAGIQSQERSSLVALRGSPVSLNLLSRLISLSINLVLTAIHDWKQKQPRGPKFTEFLEKELTYGFPYDNIHCDYANLSSMAGEAILADFEEGHSLPASCFLRTREDTKEDLNLSLSLSSRRGQGNGPWDVQVMVEYLDKSCTGPMLELQPEQDPMLDLRLRRTTAGMHQ